MLEGIEKYFTDKDPYYREMLQMVKAQEEFLDGYRNYLKVNGFGIYYPNEEKERQKFDRMQRMAAMAKQKKKW